MKIVAPVFLLLIVTTITWAQTNNGAAMLMQQELNNTALSKQEYKNNLRLYNLGKLWTQTNDNLVLGYIGPHYQRIRIKIFSAVKNTHHPNIYTISGASKVKDNICHFRGTIKIIDARTYIDEEESKIQGIKKRGILFASYLFREDSSEQHSGIFSGTMYTQWYIDSFRHIHYDDIESVADGYSNNQYAGTWQAYRTHKKMVCNWGDYRIPFSDKLDVGAGDFAPADEYLKYGWQSYHDNYMDDNATEQVWWK